MKDRTSYKADTPQTRSSSFRLSFEDVDFMRREELRPVRLQLELLKPELVLQDNGIDSTIVVFGSARVPAPEDTECHCDDTEAALAADPGNPVLQRAAKARRNQLERCRYYDEARRFGRLVSEAAQTPESRQYVIMTGGGPGIMEAGNRGAAEAGGKTIGLSIVLPREQAPNRWITPELSFQFHYFGIRKMQFLMRAKALAVFPGGFGTLDELFETLTLVQTRKIRRLPIVLFHRDYWDRLVRFEVMAEEGLIDRADLELITFVETAEQGVAAIRDFYGGELPCPVEEPPPV